MINGASSTFGSLLRSFRLAAGLTQEALAEKASLSTRGIQDLERGVHATPRADTVQLLVTALELSTEERAALIAAAHPELAAPPAIAGGLNPARPPIPPTPLVGREGEVAAACALLRHSGARLLTLTGPGGVGKTRLAIAVAAALAPDFRDGVAWVDLAAVQDPDLVPAAVARALGVAEDRRRPPAEALTAAMAERHLFLILDNLEHLLPVTSLIAQLLAAAPRLTVLVTSRERLRLRGERAFAVEPLAVPAAGEAGQSPLAGLAGVPAVRLFVERAAEMRPGFVLTEENRAQIAEICRRLDGLPLALELAAARLRILPVTALLARLEQRLPVLAAGARDLPPRQQTMRDTIAWSYDLLTAAEQALFRRFSVFAGGCTLDAIEWVTECQHGGASGNDSPVTRHPSPITFDLVAALADKSLLRAGESVTGEPRFFVLETIREFSQEQLASHEETAAARRAHAGYYLALSETAETELAGPEQRWWLDRLEADLDNLHAALSWAVASGDEDTAMRLAGALAPFWKIRGHVRDGRSWLERPLAMPGAHSVASPVRAKALAGLGGLLTHLGEYTAAQTRLEECLALERETGTSPGIIAALQSLAMLAQKQNDFSLAADLYTQSLDLARAERDDQAIVTACNGLAIAAQAQGQLERSSHLYEESLVVARRLGAPRLIAVSLGNLGNLAADLGAPDRAVALYEESLALYREIGDQRGVAICLYSLGHQAIAAGAGNDRSAALLSEALRTFVQLGDPDAIAENVDVLARIHAERGDTFVAARLLATATELRTRTGVVAPVDPHYRADYDRAITLVRAALDKDQLAAIARAAQYLPLEQLVSTALIDGQEPTPLSATPQIPSPAPDVPPLPASTGRVSPRGYPGRRVRG